MMMRRTMHRGQTLAHEGHHLLSWPLKSGRKRRHLSSSETEKGDSDSSPPVTRVGRCRICQKDSFSWSTWPLWLAVGWHLQGLSSSSSSSPLTPTAMALSAPEPHPPKRASTASRTKSGRYFTQHLWAPPLSPWDPSATTTTKTRGQKTTPPAEKNHQEEVLHPGDTGPQPLPMVYTNDPKTVAQWLADHVPVDGTTLGFDMESVPNTPWIADKASFRGPATIQLATPQHSLVIHLARSTGQSSRACAPILEAVLQDASIVKVGCSIDQDMLELRARWRLLEAKSRFDLGSFRSLQGDGATPGLKKLTHSVLGLDLPKSRRLAASDWSRVPLTEDQIRYAARDAWAGAACMAALAARDPARLGREALMERLQSQRSLDDLYQRQSRRKQAKHLLSALLAPYQLDKKKKIPIQQLMQEGQEEFPPWKKEMVGQLHNVMKSNEYEAMEVIDIEQLGFSFSE